MKLTRLLYLFAFLMVAGGTNSCSTAEKAAQERRNLMMPEKTDLRRNKKYKAPKQKKTYKPAKRNKRR